MSAIGYTPGVGYDIGRSKQAPFPFVRNLSVDVIASAGDKLWRELVGTNTTLNVSTIQLAFTGIDAVEQGQRSIEGFLKPTSASSPKKRPRDKDQDVSPDLAADVNEINHNSDSALDTRTHERQSKGHVLSWTCPRCGKTFHLLENLPEVDDIRQEALSTIRLEHEDFHFAEDLAKESSGDISPVKPTTRKAGFKPGTVKKGRKEPHGLDKYFSKK